MSGELLVAGGGIGGLAAALAARHAGWEARVFEQAAAFSEAGAGVQLGPNVTRILAGWGLLDGALARSACRPRRLSVRDGVAGGVLAEMRLDDFEQRYGGPYLTVHRADLQVALLDAVRAEGVRLHTGRRVQRVTERADGIRVATQQGPEVEGEALVGADGLWSFVRGCVTGDTNAPAATGHLAYRGLAAASGSDEVTAWLAPDMHLVTYPLRGGAELNVVCVVEGHVAGDPRGWDHAAVAESLQAAVGEVCGEVRAVLEAVPQWRLWSLHERAPVADASALARGRMALVGDAAHPMLPYLAQGAAMAIEDARALQQVLAVADDRVVDVPTALRRYALNRWQRVARVQERSHRNGTIFHAAGPVRVARNLALKTMGDKLLDQPWLYGG